MSQTVAFFPGLLCDDALFTAQTKACEAAGYETYVADFGAAHHESFDAMALDVLADLPDRFSLVGLSMGGYAALKRLVKWLEASMSGERADQTRVLLSLFAHLPMTVEALMASQAGHVFWGPPPGCAGRFRVGRCGLRPLSVVTTV